MMKNNIITKVSYPVFHISEKTFIEIMSNLKKQYILDKSNAKFLQKAFNSDNFIGGYDNTILNNSLLKILKVALKDENDWIGYFIYELEWGKKYKKGCVIDNNKNYNISNEHFLYIFLIENMMTKSISATTSVLCGAK